MKRAVFILVVLFVFAVPFLYAQEQDSTSLTQSGQSVPDFAVSTIDGELIKIGDLKGKVVWLNFFATWCPACMAEMPRLENEVWQKLKEKDFIVLALGREHTQEELKAFQKEKGFSFSIAPDPKREVYRLFAKQTIPRNYVINQEGIIVHQSTGYTPEEFDILMGRVQEALEK